MFFFSLSLSQLWFVQRKLAQKLAINKFKTLQTIVFVWSCFFSSFEQLFISLKWNLSQFMNLTEGISSTRLHFTMVNLIKIKLYMEFKKMILTFQFIENCIE